METFKFEVDGDGIGLATFDVPGKSMNTIGAQVIADLGEIVAKVTSDDAIKGLVITSGKQSGFCAGADLEGLGGSMAPSAGSDPEAALRDAFERAFALNRTLREMETCGKPVAAAINGLALGGGLEIALACHYRIAANDNPKLQLGLPEAKVGLLPGGGGTQRLPRLMGAQAAAPFLLQGKSMKAEEAKGLGVIHETAPTADLVAKAKEWVKANPNAKAPWDMPKFRIPGGGPESPMGRQVFSVGPAMIAKETWGNYPAQKHILSCVYEGLSVPMDNAIRIESRYFLKTMMTPEAKGMVRTLFLSMQALSKGASRPAGVAPYEINKVAVIGAGPLGLELAQAMHRLGVQVEVFDAGDSLAGLPPETSAALYAVLSDSFPIHLHCKPEPAAHPDGVDLSWPGNTARFERVLVAAGRPPSLDALELENADLDLDDHGTPIFDPDTLQCGDAPVFIAGDANHDRPLLHEASDEGTVAGCNAATWPKVSASPRKTPLALSLTRPEAATIGTIPDPDDGTHVTGTVDYADQGRAKVMGQAHGLVRLHASATDGRLTGASLCAPGGEHLAHLLAWVIQQGLTASDALDLPFYHPTLAEGLQTALRDICRQTERSKPWHRDDDPRPGSHGGPSGT